ncbi:MAG: sulfatase-like hydrolase/transferase [Planctomycetes bacterium]|nr:sulfatase-like hydrolase/transferase [Planctomycetota bacterium]
MLRVYAILVGVVLLCLGLSCERREERSAREVASGPSVLLITLDTTRADRLGCYGYKAAQTPSLDALAATGVKFDQAYCQVPLTLPSHASLLTGTYPRTNGIRINGVSALGSDIPTLAEVFANRGYRTGAFIGAWVLDSMFGLDRGFQRYDDDLEANDHSPAPLTERRADVVCDRALAWLKQDSETPFFAWVHFFDPHEPYAPPLPYRERLPDPYDGEIAFMDSQVQRLVAYLDASGLRQRTLLVAAGDHGEAFNEHEETQHGLFVYDTTMHVPLILSFPPAVPGGAVIGEGVRLVDVFPTIVDLLGWDLPEGLEGASLKAACENGPGDFLPIYGESHYAHLSYGWSPLKSLTTADWKYIEAPRAELYSRHGDPDELMNIIEGHPNVAFNLREQLLDMVREMTPRAVQSVAVGEDAIRRLRSLGYVSGSGASVGKDVDFEVEGRDPKDMVGVYHGASRAAKLLEERSHDQVVALVEKLVRQSPESDELYVLLGAAYLEVGRPGDAQQAYEASLRTIPNNPQRLRGLGEALRRQGKIDDAIASFQAALALIPDYAQAHCGLGLAYGARRQYQEALPHFQRHLELSPEAPVALTNLGGNYLAMGKPGQALPLLQKAIQVDPGNEIAHRYLWQAFLATGREPEMIAALRTAHEVLPDDRVLTSRLAFMLATTPRPDLQNAPEAVCLAEQALSAAPEVPEILDAAAAAYAASGDFQRAIETADRAASAAAAKGNTALARQIYERLQLYQSRRPFVR